MISLGKIFKQRTNLVGKDSKDSMRTQQGMVDVLANSYTAMRMILNNGNIDHPDVSPSPQSSQSINIINDISTSHSNNYNPGSLISINPLTESPSILLQASQAITLISSISEDTTPHLTNGLALQCETCPIPVQFTREELVLLDKILKEDSSHSGNGDINWSVVEQEFKSVAIKPNNNIHIREKNRLIRTHKKRLQKRKLEETAVSISTDPNLSSSTSSSSSSHEPLYQMRRIENQSENESPDDNNSSSSPFPSSHEPSLLKRPLECLSPDTNNSFSSSSTFSLEPLRQVRRIDTNNPVAIALSSNNPSSYNSIIAKRIDDLEQIERTFVQNYGKECMSKGKNVESSALWNAYRIEFPQWNRDSVKLKKSWENWKKDNLKKNKK